MESERVWRTARSLETNEGEVWRPMKESYWRPRMENDGDEKSLEDQGADKERVETCRAEQE